MNNSVYGKTIENLRERINVRLVNNAKDYKKYVSKPSFVLQNIFRKKFTKLNQFQSLINDSMQDLVFSI